MKLLRFYFQCCTWFWSFGMSHSDAIYTVQLIDETVFLMRQAGKCIELCFYVFFPPRSSRGLDWLIDDLDCQVASFCTNKLQDLCS